MNKKEREFVEDLRDYGFCNWILGRSEDNFKIISAQTKIKEIEEKYHFEELFNDKK